MNHRIPEGWEVCTLSDLANIDSEILKNNTDPNYRFRYIDISSVKTAQIDIPTDYISFSESPSRARKRVRKGDVLMSTVRPNLKGFAHFDVEGDDFVASTGFAVITAKKTSNGNFLYQSILSVPVTRQIESLVAGSNYPAISSSNVKSLEVLAPPLPEQQKIASILSSVDTVIEKTRAQIDKLRDLKTGMMQELLTKGIGHTEFKDSPVGRIPVAWDVVSLNNTGKWKGGGTPSKANKEYWQGNIPWVSPKDMKSEFIEETEDYISEAAISKSSTNMVLAGSVLMVVRSGILKHTLPVAIASVDLTINQDMKALTVNKGFSALYIYQYLLANNYKILRATLKAGNTVESLDFSEFSEYLIPYPSLDEQHKIANVVESIAGRVRAKELILKKYKNLKKALMQDLLTGKVRVNVS